MSPVFAAGKAGESFVVFNLFTFQLSNSVKGELILSLGKGSSYRRPKDLGCSGSVEGLCFQCIFRGFGSKCK